MRRHPRVVAGFVAGFVAVVVLAVVIGALGGWARTTPDDVRVVEPGVEVGVTPFRVRLDNAAAAYELDGSIVDDGLAYVVVEGEISLDDDESVGSGIVGEAIRSDLAQTYDAFGTQQDDAEPHVLVASDGSTLLGVGPGLTYGVRLVFTLDESAVPDEITVSLLEHVSRKSSLDGEVGWFDPTTSARVTMDVAPLPAARPAEDDLL